MQQASRQRIPPRPPNQPHDRRLARDSSCCSSSPASGPSPRIAVVGAYSALASSDAAQATGQLNKTILSEESIIYDRTGKVELARFGDAKRDVVDVRGDPADHHRCHDRGRGQDVLGERRLRSASRSSRPDWTRCAATAAAPRRSPSSSSARGSSPPDLVQDPNRTAERKLKEIIQSIRRDRGVPGRATASRRSSPPTSTRTTTATRATA